jgi:hypothetical protein
MVSVPVERIARFVARDLYTEDRRVQIDAGAVPTGPRVCMRRAISREYPLHAHVREAERSQARTCAVRSPLLDEEIDVDVRPGALVLVEPPPNCGATEQDAPNAGCAERFDDFCRHQVEMERTRRGQVPGLEQGFTCHRV